MGYRLSPRPLCETLSRPFGDPRATSRGKNLDSPPPSGQIRAIRPLTRIVPEMSTLPPSSAKTRCGTSIWKDGLALLLLLVFVTLIFEYTVAIRRPWFGVLSSDELALQWPSGLMLTFVQNWYEEGPIRLRFGMLRNPPSIEFQDLADRGSYLSYPCGAVVTLYIWTKLLARSPTPAELMRFNLMNHFLIAWVLTLTAYTVFTAVRLKVE